MMTKSTPGIAILFALLLTAGLQTEARAQLALGGHVGINVQEENDNIFAGAQARFGLGALPFTINPSIETYFIEGLRLLQLDVNGLMGIGGDFATTFLPYVGAGLAVQFADNEFIDTQSELGLNLIAGASFAPASAIQPFIQVRYTVIEAEDPVAVMGGILFTFGGR